MTASETCVIETISVSTLEVCIFSQNLNSQKPFNISRGTGKRQLENSG